MRDAKSEMLCEVVYLKVVLHRYLDWSNITIQSSCKDFRVIGMYNYTSNLEVV